MRAAAKPVTDTIAAITTTSYPEFSFDPPSISSLFALRFREIYSQYPNRRPYPYNTCNFPNVRASSEEGMFELRNDTCDAVKSHLQALPWSLSTVEEIREEWELIS